MNDDDCFDWDLWEIQMKYLSLLLSANRRYGHYEVIHDGKEIKEVK